MTRMWSGWDLKNTAGLLILLLLPWQGLAGEVICAPPRGLKPVVAVFTDRTPVIAVHVEDAQAIRKMVDETEEGTPGTEWDSKTVSEFDFKSAFGIAYDTSPGNRCYFIRTVEANFGVRKHEIYIPSEYAKDSCQYKALWEHEMKHVNADIQLVHDYSSYIDLVLREWIATLEPVVADSPEEATEIVSEKVGKLVDPILGDFARVQKFRIREINARSEYEKIRDLCPSW